MPGWAEKHDNDAAATPKGATPKQIVSAEQRKLREDAAKAAAAEVEPLAVLSQAEQENAAPNDTAVAQAHVKAGAVQTVADEDESKTVEAAPEPEPEDETPPLPDDQLPKDFDSLLAMVRSGHKGVQKFSVTRQCVTDEAARSHALRVQPVVGARASCRPSLPSSPAVPMSSPT